MLNNISNDETNRTEHSDTIDVMTPSNPSVAEIPSIISNTFSELERYKNNVEISERKANNAINSARYARSQSAGLFQKKAAIEALQTATVENADAIGSLADAEKVSFEYQKKLGQFCKFLFALGVKNIAANRSVVRELELKLSGATKEELDDLARQEILNVIKQLKAQEDIMIKQEKLSENLKERINYDVKQDEHIGKIDELNKIQDEQLEKLTDKIEKLEKTFDILPRTFNGVTYNSIEEMNEAKTLYEAKVANDKIIKKANKKSLWCLILAIAAYPLGATVVLWFPAIIVSIILGINSLKEKTSKKGLSIAGFIINGFTVLIFVLALIIGIIANL